MMNQNINQSYDPGLEVTGDHWIKLHRNENLFVENEFLKTIGTNVLSSLNISQYPDSNCVSLRKKLGDIYNIDPDNVFIGNGSDEILSVLLQYLRSHFSEAVTQTITYRIYPILLQKYKYKHLTLEGASKERLCIIDSPNSLTGEVRQLGGIPSGFLIWDNVYGEFAEEQLNLSSMNSSTAIIRSFSKFYGLANLRIGYCFADREIIKELMKIKDIYNVNGFAQEMATRVLEHKHLFDSLIPEIKKARNELQKGLKSLGFAVSNSQTNCLWVTHPNISAQTLKKHLEKSYIAVRWYPEPNLSDFLRITIPPLQVVNYLLDVIKQGP